MHTRTRVRDTGAKFTMDVHFYNVVSLGVRVRVHDVVAVCRRAFFGNRCVAIDVIALARITA